MAKRYYQLAGGGTQLNVYDDPQMLDQAALQGQLDAFVLFRSLDDTARGFLAQGGIPGAGIAGGWPDLASFDAYLDGEIDRLRDVLDYFSYESRVENLTVRDGAWVTPEALSSVSHANVGEPGTNTIDGDFGTWWQSDQAGVRSIVWQVRPYPKHILGVRFRVPNTDVRAQIQNVTIKAAGGLPLIDDPGNVVETGVDFTYLGDIWVEHMFPPPGVFSKRWLKMEFSQSLHVLDADQVRIREVEVRVGVTNHEL